MSIFARKLSKLIPSAPSRQTISKRKPAHRSNCISFSLICQRAKRNQINLFALILFRNKYDFFKAIHYKRERRPITLELQEREEHLRAARNYGEEAEEKDREEGEGREPREEA